MLEANAGSTCTAGMDGAWIVRDKPREDVFLSFKQRGAKMPFGVQLPHGPDDVQFSVLDMPIHERRDR